MNDDREVCTGISVAALICAMFVLTVGDVDLIDAVISSLMK